MAANLTRRSFVVFGAAAVGSLATQSALAAKLVHPKGAHHSSATPASATKRRHKLRIFRGKNEAVDEAAAVRAPRIPAQAGARERFVHVVNAHTSESLRAVYWRDGIYLPDTMRQVNFVLRDHMSGDVHVMDPHLIDLLGDLRHAVSTSDPFMVISGYRSPRTNAWLHQRSGGVAAHSLHMKGQAADIMLADEHIAVLHNAALALGEGGVGYYPRSGFVHVDTGAVRQWAYE